MRRLILLLCCLPLTAPAAEPAAVAEELERLLEVLPGRFSGPMPDGGVLYHKIVGINAPQFGATALYHQISRDGFDSSKPLQQKIYAFDRDSMRVANKMRAWVIDSRAGLANIERSQIVINALDPTQLQSFPDACAIRWTEDQAAGSFTARVERTRCSYGSAAFGGQISPEMTYLVSPAKFIVDEALYRDTGEPLFPPTGAMQAARLPQPLTMAAVLAAASDADWRVADPLRTLYLELDAGRVVIELAPEFAPAHVARLLELVRTAYFDELGITRVQDNFVVQWGGAASGDASRRAPLPGEFSRIRDPALEFTALPDPDGYAKQVGFSNGFAVGSEGPDAETWLAHCYGAVGVGRDAATDSGAATELYVVIGHAPRQLDRNITLLGRVLRGMELLAPLPRGTDPMGFYTADQQPMLIRRMRLAADVPAAEHTPLEVMRTDTATFAALIESRRNRRDDWYARPAGHIELCNVPVPVRDAR